MKTTAAALRELQEHFDSLAPRPNVREIAKIAGLSYPTATRYLNGTTKQGLPDKVRALAKALGRDDIMAEVVAETPTRNADAWWITEVQRVMREEYTEQIERERRLREESEQRFDRILAQKDAQMKELMRQVHELDEDKRRYERAALLVIFLFVLYFIVFDLPHPDTGLTEAIRNLLK